MSGISDIIEALVPIFGIVVLGYFFGIFTFFRNSFWDSADKLTYYILLPALLITRLSAAELQQPGILAMSGILLISIVVLSVLLVLLQNYIQKAPEAFCSVFQGSIRPNIYVVLATAAALFGEEGITLVAIALATVTPLVNFLSIWVINYYSSGSNRSKVSIALSVVKNPIIIGCVTGILLNISNIVMPFGTAKFGEILGSAALPVGLMSVGAGLNIRIDDSWKMMILSSTLKLVVLPILVALTCLGFAVEGITREIAVLLSSVPCAASSYIFATQLGGDEELMARIISLETLMALLTMPLCLWIFFNHISL